MFVLLGKKKKKKKNIIKMKIAVFKKKKKKNFHVYVRITFLIRARNQQQEYKVAAGFDGSKSVLGFVFFFFSKLDLYKTHHHQVFIKTSVKKGSKELKNIGNHICDSIFWT